MHTRNRLLSLMATALLILPAFQSANATTAAPVYREIKEWLIACDNTRFCEAKGFNDQHDGLMRITREAGPNGKLEVMFELPKPISMLTPKLDGRVFTLSGRDWKQESSKDA